LIETVEQIEEAVDVSVRFTARLAARSGLPGKDSNSLPFMPASAVRPGMLMVNEAGDFDVVESVDPVELEASVYDIDVDQTHNFIANGLVTHNSIYAFRGADINNILDFERDFPGTRTIALEQNYRSTNSILNTQPSPTTGAQAEGARSELGTVSPSACWRWRTSTPRRGSSRPAPRARRGRFSGDEVAIFYRTNAQSRVLEDVLVRQGVGYQVIGGPRFYERAEIKDAIAYLQVIDNPYDAVSLQRIANRPRRGIGDSSLARLQTWADAQGRSLWEATEFAEEAGVGAAPLKAVQGFRTMMQSLQSGAPSFPSRAPRAHPRLSGYL
jgi:DNA helicase-2/ATP-dependent DNA helicase PcrA